MNREIARTLIQRELKTLRKSPYAELTSLVDKGSTRRETGQDGREYQIERQAVWDDRKGGNLRVVVAIDDGGVRAFMPLSGDFIISPSGVFIGETPQSSLHVALKEARILHAALLVTIPLYIYAGETLSPATGKDDTKIGLFLVALAILNTWSVLTTYRRRAQPARVALQSGTPDAKAISRWRNANILLLVSCEPLALYGFALRLSGGTLLHSAPFYVWALFLLVSFTPRRLSDKANS